MTTCTTASYTADDPLGERIHDPRVCTEAAPGSTQSPAPPFFVNRPGHLLVVSTRQSRNPMFSGKGHRSSRGSNVDGAGINLRIDAATRRSTCAEWLRLDRRL